MIGKEFTAELVVIEASVANADANVVELVGITTPNAAIVSLVNEVEAVGITAPNAVIVSLVNEVEAVGITAPTAVIVLSVETVEVAEVILVAEL